MTPRLRPPRCRRAGGRRRRRRGGARARRRAAARSQIEIVRNGSRGLYWLEPMVEVETPPGRVAYGPVDAAQTLRPVRRRLARRRTASPVARADRRNPVPEAPDAADLRALRHRRSAFARRLSRAWRHEGPRAGRSRMQPADIVEAVKTSGLRGRGGAGFPTGIKWETVRTARAIQKYIVCNADEGDSGTFADRMIMEGDPFVLIEGMAIAGLAVGATKGFIYLRSEYPHARDRARGGDRRGAARPACSAKTSLGSGPCLRSGGAGRRRRLCLRRGDVAARKPRRQARAGARQAAAPGAQGPLRQADRHQQRHLARHRAVHPRRGRGGLSRLRHGPLARHDADPARRQRQLRRALSRPRSASRSASS